MSMLPPDPIYIFAKDMSPISCITFKITSSTECIYAGTQAGVVHVWSLKSKRESGNFKIGDDTCLSINIFQEDIIITHDKSGIISFWKEYNNNNWSLTKQIKTDFFGFCKSLIFQDILYTILKDSKCQTILIKTEEPWRTLNLSDSNKLGEIMVFRVYVLNNRKVMLVAYEGNRLVLWDLDTPEKVSELELESCPMAVDFDTNTSKGLCGDPSDKILVFSLNNKLDFKIERTIKLTNAGVASVRIRPDGKLAAVGCWDGKVRLYSWKSLVLLAVLNIHSSTVQDVCFSEGYREGQKCKFLLAAGSQDCRISLWDLYN